VIPSQNLFLTLESKRCDGVKPVCGRCQASRTAICVYESATLGERLNEGDSEEDLNEIKLQSYRGTSPDVSAFRPATDLPGCSASVPEDSSAKFDVAMALDSSLTRQRLQGIQNASPFVVSPFSYDEIHTIRS
jgi:hypothetical protein